MMEPKLWIALCAILVIHLGSATLGLVPVPSSTTHSLTTAETDPASSATGGLYSNTTDANVTIAPEAKNNNVVTSASDATTTTITHLVPSVSQSHSTTPVPSHNDTTHITQTPFLSTSVTPNPSSNKNVSQPQNTSNKPSQAPALPASSTPKSEPSKPGSTTITTTTTTTTTTNSSTTSTSSSQNPTTSQLTTNTSQSNRPSSTTQPNNQANPQTNDPSALNSVDTTTTRDSPGLDPLLAGLVSAFIIAAVIITLLLFLKLRRRGNRPEFRRLQDLPMDDMEDTPLSMYSY